MRKNAQVTIFMILGFLVFVVSIFMFSIYHKITVKIHVTDDIITHKFSTDPVSFSFQECLEKNLRNGIYNIAFHGGYLYPSGAEKYGEPGDGQGWYNYYYFEEIKLPFIYDGKFKNLRKKQEIEKMISNYVFVEIESCVSYLEPFREQGFNITFPSKTAISVLTRVQNSKVISTIHFPVIVVRGDQVKNFDVFLIEVNLRLGKLYDQMENILNDLEITSQLDLSLKCPEKSINIYLESNEQTFEHVLRIVDAEPLSSGNPPLIFQVAIKNVDVLGECNE